MRFFGGVSSDTLPVAAVADSIVSVYFDPYSGLHIGIDGGAAEPLSLLLGQTTTAGSLSVVLASDATLPLPTGAATGAKQDTTNSYLATMGGQIASLVTQSATTNAYLSTISGYYAALATGAKQDTTNAYLATMGGQLATLVTQSATTNAYLATIGSLLSNIVAGIPDALGQTTMAGSVSMVIASNQSTVPVNQTTTQVGYFKLRDDSGIYNVNATIVGVGGALGLFPVLAVDTAFEFANYNNDGSFPVTGNVAHDSPDTLGAVKIGGKAVSAEPTAVASGDRVDAYFDLKGYQQIINRGYIEAGSTITGICVSYTTSASTNGADVTIPTGSRSADFVVTVAKTGTPTDIQFFMQAKDGTSYFTMKNGFLGKFIFDDTAVATAQDLHVTFPCPKTGTMRVRVTTTGCTTANFFTVSNAKLFFGS